MSSSPLSYADLDRPSWAALAGRFRLSLDEGDVRRLRALGEPVGLDEVREIYLPLARLLLLQAEAQSRRREATAPFLGEPVRPSPFVVAVVGSVAAGKSTASRILRELLARSPGTPRVALVPTDGFLLPNAELERRGILGRKGWPESYDLPALLRFLTEAKAGVPHLVAPAYSHLTYDVLPGPGLRVERPDILIVEGLTLLQAPATTPDGRPRGVVSDSLDAAIYVDADVESLRTWFADRFLALRDGAFQQPNSYFRRYAHLRDTDALAIADGFWREVNEPNLLQHILPTRGRASVILEKASDHRVRRVRVRRW